MVWCKSNVVLAIVFASFVSGYQPPKKTTISCTSDAQCYNSIPFTVCADNSAYSPGVCSCTIAYVLRQIGSKYDCLEEAKLFNDPCIIDAQCKATFGDGGACIQNKCRCSPTAHFINLKCWTSRKLGESCGDPNNCVATDHSQCNGVCSCVSGFIGNPANTKCLKIAQKLGDSCEDSVQCKPVNQQASCEYNVCLCPKGYLPKGDKGCVKSAKRRRVPKGYNSAAGLKESVAMIFIAIVMLVLKY